MFVLVSSTYHRDGPYSSKAELATSKLANGG